MDVDTTKDRGIPRTKIEPEECQYEEMRNTLFARCQDNLGYNANESLKPGMQRAHLMQALATAGIAPLDEQAVEDYKNKQELKANHVLLRAFAHIAIMVVTWTLFVLLGKPKDTADWIFMVVVFPGIVALIGGGAICWGPGDRKSWKVKPLRGYSLPVPEFALSYALAIHDANCAVNFEIEELTEDERAPDPFLVASYGDARCYIAVWAEPKFESKN
jgi:hypothetical protein